MSEPLVQSFLSRWSLDDLLREHAVTAGYSKDKHKVSLNYNMLKSKDDDVLACQCRGLILAKVDGSPISPSESFGENVVLARPMDRFFNKGQGAAEKINLSDPKTAILEKLDGTLGLVYYDPFLSSTGSWCVGTRSVPDADHPIDGFTGHTFRTLFETCLAETLRAKGAFWHRQKRERLERWSLFDVFCADELGSALTYSFEITSPMNKVYVTYGDFRVTLLAVRDTATGREHDPESFLPEVYHPRVYSFGSIPDMVEYVSKQEPSQFEGVVVRGALCESYPRMKVKNPGYLAAKRLVDAAANSPRALLEVVLLGKHDDVFVQLPEHLRGLGERYLRGYRSLVTALDEQADYLRRVAERSPENPRKAVALEIREKSWWLAPLMDIYGGHSKTAAEFFEHSKKDGTWNDTFLDAVIVQVDKCCDALACQPT